jgi:hypothetical protein
LEYASGNLQIFGNTHYLVAPVQGLSKIDECNSVFGIRQRLYQDYLAIQTNTVYTVPVITGFWGASPGNGETSAQALGHIPSNCFPMCKKKGSAFDVIKFPQPKGELLQQVL